jgi:general secretion pathway protein I
MVRSQQSVQRRQTIRRDCGFTLVEVVVAIAILALLAGAIFRATSDSIRNMHRADALTDASALAQSLLAKVGNEIPLEVSELRGQTGTELEWHLEIRPYDKAEDRKQWPVAAYVVVAEVTFRDEPAGRPVALKTLRLGPKGDAS